MRRKFFAALLVVECCLGQDKPVRKRSEVEARGLGVIAAYEDRKLAGYGILDATKRPYLADPSGKRDSTQAVTQAMRDARDARLVTFLPAGTYLVSSTLECVQGTVTRDHWDYGPADPVVENESYHFPCSLVGEGQAATRIVLAGRAKPFQDAADPKPVIHFWARNETRRKGKTDPLAPQPNISFNQTIMSLSIDLGGGNPGAIAIEHQCAQGSSIQDVSIEAGGAFAGVRRLPGSGGGIHGLTVNGGRYGIYGRGNNGLRGSQPVPVVSGAVLKGQTEAAILYDGRGPLTVVGATIEGAGIRSDAPRSAPWDGAVNVVDSILRPAAGVCAVASAHPVYLADVFVDNGGRIACVEGAAELKASGRGWMHVKEYASGAGFNYPEFAGGGRRDHEVWVDGKNAGLTRTSAAPSGPPPPGLVERHSWKPLAPAWRTKGAVNVREAPYSAAGDGKTDDAAAIQRAIDEHEVVFVPKGTYALSRPLVLRPRTRLAGVSQVLTRFVPLAGGGYLRPQAPAPLIDTADDPAAETAIEFVRLEVPVTNPAAYALRWRAGAASSVRYIAPAASFWHPDAPAAVHPMVRIEGNGGGRWYGFTVWHWWNQGPDYRHLLVDGTHHRLAFYMLNPEHPASTAQVEFRSARNVDVFSLKAEGSFVTLLARNSGRIRVFGYGGVGSPWHEWPIFRFVKSADFLLANVNPQIRLPQPGVWGALALATDPSRWYILDDRGPGGRVRVPGSRQFVLYRRGEP